MQVKMAAALGEGVDIATVLGWVKPPRTAETDPQDAIFNRLATLWKSADDETRRRFLFHVGDAQDFSYLEAAE